MDINDQANLRKRILSDRYNTIIFGNGRDRVVYLVGGYIRDLLLKRKCPDRDFVIRGQFEATLSRIASDLGTRAVRIGDKGLFRMIVKKKLTLDFSPIRRVIHYDLSQRDFTVNALAWTPEAGIIDETSGMKDIGAKSLRMISAANLRDDPVRVIRAYRLAAALSFRIDLVTRRTLRAFGFLVRHAKRERTTLEFFKILNLSEAAGALRLMHKDRVLGRIILHDDKTLDANIKAVSMLGRNLNGIPLKYVRLLPSEFSQNLSYLGFLRLSFLLSGLPENILSLSSKICKFLELNERGRTFCHKKKLLSGGDLFDLFLVTREAAPFFLIVNNLTSHFPDYIRYLRVQKRVILSADRIKDITGLSDGRRLGSMLLSLKKAHYTGFVKSAREATSFVRNALLSEVEVPER